MFIHIFSENLGWGVGKILFHMKQTAGIERHLLVGTDDEVSFGVLPTTPLDHQKHTIILQEVQRLWHSGLFVSHLLVLLFFTFINLDCLLFVSCNLA